MSSIQSLDRNREYWVALMQDLAERVPEYVWLTLVKQAPSVPLTLPTPPNQAAPKPVIVAATAASSIEGYSFSLNALATFLIRLKKSDMFDNIGLSSVKLQEIEKINAYSFKLTCNFMSTWGSRADTETAQAAGSQVNQF
jgi:Tfp pilus assembly protein PilN